VREWATNESMLFGARAGDNADLAFVTSDSISIFLVTIVSSDPYFLTSAKLAAAFTVSSAAGMLVAIKRLNRETSALVFIVLQWIVSCAGPTRRSLL